FTKYEDQINKGIIEADDYLGSRNHFMNPNTRKGLGGFIPSGNLAEQQFATGINYWLNNNQKESMYYLGLVLHLIQDSTVPHHAVPTILSGHLEFENWLSSNTYKYLTAKTGDYTKETVYEYILSNSKQALSVFSLVSGGEFTNYDRCAKNIVPLAQQTSAGSVQLFFETIEDEQPIVMPNTLDFGIIGLFVVAIGIVVLIIGKSNTNRSIYG
ncbi:unnamed protein product, partial [marine sediment metagenome]